MRLKAILIGTVVLLAVLVVVELWAPEWRDEARLLLRELARALR
ncbi:MAG: hypothetical protein V4795_14635 [Pseudomonadota bacterium]